MLYALQTAFFEPDKEAFPAFCIFFHAFHGSDDLTVTVLIHADCHQNADIFKLSAPISLEINPIHINIRIFSGQPAVAPFLNMHIRFLIQITDGGSRHPTAPKGFRNILHTPDRNTGEIHLDQGFLNRAFTAAVALNDGGFKRDTFQLRDIQRYLSGCGCQLAAVVSRTVPLPRFGALIFCRTRQFLCFLVQQRIQRFLHAVSHHFFQFALDSFLV